MKSLKLLLSVIALAVVAAAPVLRAEDAPAAPPAPSPAGGSDHKGPRGDRLKELSDKLGLTDDQKAKIKPILLDEAQAIKALREDTSVDKEARRAKIMEIHKAHVDQINAILTPEQQAKFKAGREQHKKAQQPAPAPEPTK